MKFNQSKYFALLPGLFAGFAPLDSQAAPVATQPGAQMAACAAGQVQPNNAYFAALNNPNDSIHIQADSADGLLEEQRVNLEGNVQITQLQQSLVADHASYDVQAGELAARGNVTLLQPGIRIRADRINYNLQSSTGKALQSDYLITQIPVPARGEAAEITFLDKTHSEFAQITYTTCPPGQNDWQLHADTLQIDRAEGVGTAHDATLSFMDVPVAYLPWLTFPIDNRRKSGFLPPSIGYGDKDGLDLTIPYYLNLAPNYDLTLAPRIISKRGVMLGTELRFLTPGTQGILRAEYLSQDNKNPLYPENRGSFSLDMRSQFSNHLGSNIQIEHVSDDGYLDDLGNPLSISTESLLQRRAELRYQTTHANLVARLKNYQVLNEGSEPYSILPQIKLDMQMPGQQSGLLYQLDTEIVHFTKDDDEPEGTRLDIYPSVSLPMQDDYYHLTPKIGTRYTQYALNNQADGAESSPSRWAGILSLDSGLYFERDTTYFGADAQQTLEPRLYYLYTTRHNHHDIPVFDTSLYGFTTASLFRENRFNSVDRLGDANQISLSLTTRYNDNNTGREKLRASIGQIFYLQDREVNLPGRATEQDTESAVAGEFTAYISQNWRTRGNVVWDTRQSKIDQALAQINYRRDNNHLFNLSYRKLNDTVEQAGLSAIWPLGKQIKALAHWRYSMEEQRTRESIAGLEYSTCCWRVRTLMRQRIDANNEDKEDLAFFIQLELNGLGKLGDDFEDLLTKSIYGYRRED